MEGSSATGADHLAGFIGGGGDERQPRRDAGLRGSFGGDAPQLLPLGDELDEQGGVDRDGLPLPVGGGCPALGFIVEGDVTHLAADRIHKPPGEQAHQVPGEENVMAGGFPDLGLVGGEPVGFCLSLQVSHCFTGAGHLESCTP